MLSLLAYFTLARYAGRGQGEVLEEGPRITRI